MPDTATGGADGSEFGIDQLPLDLTLEPQWGREDFLVGPSNEEACRLVEAWPDWPARLLVLVGPPASGKTHLARIWSATSGAAVVSPAELSADRLPLLARQHAVIDGAPHGLDPTALFHLINMAAERGTGLMITTREPPSAWGLALPDLVSRLRRAVIVSLGEPDDALIRAVLVKLFLDRQLAVDTGLVDYAATRLERSFGAARRFVAALDRLSLASSRRPGRRLAARVLDLMDSRRD
jgi:chromosomal replication initiation ATPase DnaA